MTEQTTHIISRITDRWNRNYLLGFLIRNLAIILLLLVIFAALLQWPTWWVVALLAISVILNWLIYRPRRVNEQQVISHLNHRYPQLEESAQLLVVPVSSLNLLQRLQLNKTNEALQMIPFPGAMNRPLKNAASFALVLLCLAALVFAGGNLIKTNPVSPAEFSRTGPPVYPPPVGLKSFEIRVQPPAYTNLKPRNQADFSLSVPEGSVVDWFIQTTGLVNRALFIFNGTDSVELRRSDRDSNHWRLKRQLSKPGFYQVQLDGQPSALYQLELIPDQPAKITISSPRQYTSFEPGQKAIANLRVHLEDDYGLVSASIISTRASGKGEAVSFKEQELFFEQNIRGLKTADLSRALDLVTLGLNPGDELYFYIRVKDSRGQESRSDMYFLSLADTEELMSLSGLTAGVNQMPEYFRSQRQIIIDTEKLLRDQQSISKDSFNRRSNELGTDQKLLRLRYGKFLGEENESGAHSPDDGHDHGEELPEYGDAQALMDQIGHKHDNAEDPDFFDPQQKARLKAVLAEMWTSELKLRIFVPREALPFEYKALRLLKDLQQQSRSFVGKTASKMPPLRPEKRLTGDLSGMQIQHNQRKLSADEQLEQLRMAVSVLEKWNAAYSLSASELLLLQNAEQPLSAHAIQEPAKFLPALRVLHNLRLENLPSKKELSRLQTAILEIIGPVHPTPGQKPGSSGLSALYFEKLQTNK